MQNSYLSPVAGGSQADSLPRTPEQVTADIFSRARQEKKRILLPEATDIRILQAAALILEQEIADIILLGDAEDIHQLAAEQQLNLQKAEIIDPADAPRQAEYAQAFAEIRREKGITPAAAQEKMQDISYFATMMVQMGQADGMVSGAQHTTAETIRPALQIIKTKPDTPLVSSSFLMLLPDRPYIFADCAVNVAPNPEQLAGIALSSAETARTFGISPRVAMLSYSTGTSGKGAGVDAVAAATQLVESIAPDLPIAGPIQFDAAVDETVAKAKLPNSPVAGKANVFIFPDLNSGNITYKAVQRTAGALAVGPILQGLNKPINDLSRGALVEDIVNTIAITALQAQTGTSPSAADAIPTTSADAVPASPTAPKAPTP